MTGPDQPTDPKHQPDPLDEIVSKIEDAQDLTPDDVNKIEELLRGEIGSAEYDELNPPAKSVY